MSRKPNGGPAFPETEYGGHSSRHPIDMRPGMTLRDYFAGQALAGLTANMTVSAHLSESGAAGFPTLSRSAYGYADAMLAEREK